MLKNSKDNKIEKEGIFIANTSERIGLTTLKALCNEYQKRIDSNPDSILEPIYINIRHEEEKNNNNLKRFQKYPFIKFVITDFQKVNTEFIDVLDSLHLFFKKISTIFIIPSTNNEKVEEIKLLKVQNVLLFSILDPVKNKDKMRNQHYLFEENLKLSQLNYKILRAGFFMENLDYYKDEIIYQNNLSIPIGNGEIAPISIQDIGIVASKILLNFDSYTKHIYSITGNRLYTGPMMVQLLSKYLNKTITFKPNPLLMDTEDMKEGRINNVFDMPLTSESMLHNAWLNKKGINNRCPCHKPNDGENEVISLLELCQSIASHNFNKISNDLQKDFNCTSTNFEDYLLNLCKE
ncbi:hypothetical protein BCR32DRAFT_274918 [Anaeromyces robustus]|uniref:NAD(P)-binding protein n=1 Tax=Anaeromyces robustus TaxID=1754192 RepID=A0A1Y1XMN4_9FUNG|nr:hypothetical protein BCR32DRAFT_274918 [Anaeromyces robustus]|eukprot:ORX86991.1 hypothetical protein BCR32DRAFT_274918 [Anaeromyces robustus]